MRNEGRGKREEGRGKREEGRGKINVLINDDRRVNDNQRVRKCR